MRVFFVTFFALASLAQVHAQDRIKKPDSGKCSYMLKNGATYEVASDETLCWRVPEPSYKEYTLLRCDPPALQEIVRVKPGDPRCKKYEERQ